MRILIFHGYLLSGTGSNVYNACLAEALVKLGHEVHLFSQDRHPERQSFVSAYGDWDGGDLQITKPEGSLGLGCAEDSSGSGCTEGSSGPGCIESSSGPGCTVYRPDIGGLLPLYVHDSYEGMEAKTFADCTDAEVAAYIQANVEAVREVARRVSPDLALANHLVMGPVILARALDRSTPYAVKVHGSALEYTVKPEPERFLGFAREGLAQANTVLVGSRHTAESLWRALEDPALERRTRLGSPGVDVESFTPRDPEQVETGLGELLKRLRHSAPTSSAERSSAFARDGRQAADALESILNGHGDLVVFVGKLIVSKGVDLLVAAWPLVLQSVPDARLAIVGFGAYREGLERLIARLEEGDLQGAQEIARAGRALEAHTEAHTGLSADDEAVPLRHLLAFLDSLSGAEAETYRMAAHAMGEQIVFTGRLDHEELPELLPGCEALVVPSTFPEAFGMVAVEAAACGVLPVSADHSGLAEVSDVIARRVPPEIAEWLSFPVDDDAVRAIAKRIVGWLTADRALKIQTRTALVSVARERWSWEGVARGVIAAARDEPAARPFG